MTIALISSTHGAGTSASISTTGADLLIDAPVGPGFGYCNGADSKSNTWANTTTQVDNPGSQACSIAYVLGAPIAGVGHTFSSVSNIFFQTIFGAAFSGVDSFANDDGVSNTGSGTTHPACAGSFTPAVAGSLWVSVVSFSAVPGTITPPAGMTLLEVNGVTSLNGALAYEIQSGTTARTPTWGSSNAVTSCGRTVVFYPAAGPAAVVGDASITEAANTLSADGTLGAAPQLVYPIADITTAGWLSIDGTLQTRKNLLVYTEDLANLNWTKTQTSVTADVIGTADKLVEDTNAGNHSTDAGFSGSSNGMDVMVSGEFMAAGRALLFLQLTARNGTTHYVGQLDLTSGFALPVLGSCTVTSDNLGGGWWRLKLTANLLSGAAVPNVSVQLSNGSSNNYMGDGTSGIYMTRLQVEPGTAFTGYQPILATVPPLATSTVLFSAVDEVAADAVDFIFSPDNPTTEECELKLGSPVGTISDNPTLDYQLRAIGLDTNFRITLMQATTQIAQWTENVTVAAGLATRAHTLSSGETSTITDQTDLRVRIRASA